MVSSLVQSLSGTKPIMTRSVEQWFVREPIDPAVDHPRSSRVLKVDGVESIRHPVSKRVAVNAYAFWLGYGSAGKYL